VFYGDTTRWFLGTVANAKTNDPHKQGRVQVRIYGIHSENEEDIPDFDLPWAQCLIPSTEGGTNGIGKMAKIAEGAQVFGIFLDGKTSQVPLVLGSIHKIEIPPLPEYDPKTQLEGPGFEQGQDPDPIPPKNQNNNSDWIANSSDSLTDGKGRPQFPPDLSIAEVKNWIALEARKRNIDPNIAVQVATSEALYGPPIPYQSGISKSWFENNGFKNHNWVKFYNGYESSYGPFQLYNGRDKKGGKGMGMLYEATPSGRPLETDNTRAGILNQIKFALDYAGYYRTWRFWYGPKRAYGKSWNTKAGFDVPGGFDDDFPDKPRGKTRQIDFGFEDT